MALEQFVRSLEGPDDWSSKDPSERAGMLASCWATLTSWHRALPFQDAARVLSLHTLKFINKFFADVPEVLKEELCDAIEQCRDVLAPLLAPFFPVCDTLLAAAAAPSGDVILQGLLDATAPLPTAFVDGLSKQDLLSKLECLRFWEHDWFVERYCREHLSEARRRPARSETEDGSDMETVAEELENQEFLEHLLCVLYRQRRIQELCTETSSYTCHQAVQLIRGMKKHAAGVGVCDQERLDVAEALAHVFLVRDLLLKSPYCCTRELMVLWCELQCLQGHRTQEVARAALRLVVPHAATSAQDRKSVV